MKKRSREASENDEPSTTPKKVAFAPCKTPDISPGQWISEAPLLNWDRYSGYASGMALLTLIITLDAIHGAGIPVINPLTSVRQAEEMSGSWLVQKLEDSLKLTEEEQASGSDAENEMPEARRTKAPRRQRSPGTASEGSHGATGVLDEISPDVDIDPYMMSLGVSWCTVAHDADSTAAARGLSRYVERHYPLSDVKFLAKNRRNETILASSNGCWYLFKEDLSKGRLVASYSWESAVRRLNQNPIEYEGEEDLVASSEPDAVERKSPETTAMEIVGHMDLE